MIAEQENNKKDLTDHIRQLSQEEEPKSSEYSLPSKDIYPRKVREKIVHRIDKVEEAVTNFEQAVQQVGEQIKGFTELSQQYEAALVQTDTEVKQKNNPPELTKLNNLLAQITLIEKQITRGSDIAPQMEKFLANLDSENLMQLKSNFLPSQQNRERFGQATSLRERVHRLFLSRDSYYQRQKQKYQEDSKKKYQALLSRLPNLLLQPLRGWNIKPYDRLRSGKSDKPQDQLFIYDENWQEYLEKSKQLEKNEHLLKMLEVWIKANKQTLSEVKTSSSWDENLFNLLTNEIQKSRSALDHGHRQLENFKHQLNQEIEVVIDKLVVSAESNIQLLNSKFISFEGVAHLHEAHGSYIPLEAVALRDRALKAHSQLNELVIQSSHQKKENVASRLEDMKKEIGSLSSRIETASKFNKEQQKSQNVLWHTGKFDVLINKVLRSGHLASRKSQLDLFGEATFATAGVLSMTNDRVIINKSGLPVEMSWEEYHDQNEGVGSAKKLYQEAFQIAFSRNIYDQRYFEGMALLFSEASLRSKSQFMEADGFHFFDKQYKTGRKDSSGFDVNLDQEPFVIAVTLEKANELQQRLLIILIETKKMSPEEAQQWLNDHIVIINPGSSNQDINKTAYSLMEKQGLQVESGYLVPTGERGENAIRQLNQLFAYKSLAELEKDVEEEKRTFDTAAVKAEIEKDEMIPKVLIDLLSKDTELDELYAADSGVFERFTIGQHTEMVLTQFERYFGHTMEKGKRAFMRLVLALHDIGKSKSVQETGGVEKQHEYTLPILSRVIEQMRYPTEVINLAKILVDQDYIGKLLKGDLGYSDPNFNSTRTEIHDRSQKNNITQAEYLDLIKVFYLADASSYTQDTKELGGKASLDHLFDFDREKRTIRFSSNPLQIINYQTPDQYFKIFEDAVLQN